MDDRIRRSFLPRFRLIRNFLPAPLPTELVDWAVANQSRFKATVVQLGAETKHDPDFRLSISTSRFQPLEGELRRRALTLAPELIREFNVSPSVLNSVDMELVANNDGSFLRRHIDTVTGAAWASSDVRIVSAIYYFHRQPRGFSGGCLRVYGFGVSADKYVDVQPDNNVLVAFPSLTAHEVLPIACSSRQFADSRFSVNIWLRARV